ncbi:GmrSD restriction endonuclease domain-containing protein [Microbispora bryophytorum]|uniref:GmrSD restriction endonuclease domain-containing protein n=1 Tax=Microbispora bryophytorum TaxID=1460882 RepID=UPI0033C497E4
MKADTRTPAEIFAGPARYVIPLFQRPYVWNKTDQWEPLWNDVRAVAEQVLETLDGYGGEAIPPHFLGAIVLEQQWIQAGFIPVRNVIDGQQRLTTLQILMDAAQLVAAQYGLPIDAKALEAVVLNNADLTQHPDEVFKVWPTDRDQDAYRAVLDNDREVAEELAATSIALAHAYFVKEITEWVEPEGDEEKCKRRISALTRALRNHLKLVVIDLEPGDNAQVIFETLNHRGTPLLAADLIKNLVFQLAAQQKDDLKSLYEQYWKPFDSNKWRRDVRQGRLYRPYVDIFMNYWLVTRLLRDVPADRVFAEFRDHVRRVQSPAKQIMRDIAADARVYAGLENLPWDSVEGTFYYRVIGVMEASVVGPFLLWVLRWPEQRMPAEQRHKALKAMESWLVRRMLCKLTTKNYNRILLELLRELDQGGPEIAGDITEKFLSRSTASAVYWPSDEEVIQAAQNVKVYKDLTRGRLRMVLEALEDKTRDKYAEHNHCPRGNLTIEHIMPQSWSQYWSVPAHDHTTRQRREVLVQNPR